MKPTSTNQEIGFHKTLNLLVLWFLTSQPPETWKRNICQIVMLEKTLESPLDCKEVKAVNPKGNQSWIFVGRTDAEVETPILWLPDEKNWLIGKDPDAGRDWGQAETGATEDEMVGWHHWLHGHEFEQTLGDSEGQGGLVCSSSRGRKVWDMSWCLNSNSYLTPHAKINSKWM